MPKHIDEDILLQNLHNRIYKDENDVKDAVKHMLKQFTSIKYWPGGASAYGESGIADICVCLRGFFIAIECKHKNKKATAYQKNFLREVQESGGLAIKVNEKNLDQLLECLNYVNELPFAGHSAAENGGFSIGIGHTLQTTATFCDD